VPATALQHFQEDIARARAIVAHADPLPLPNDAERLLRSDLLRSAWMFAAGALDAYYCDAYTDIVAATASSKSRQPGITLPEWFYEIKFPIRAILEEYDNPNWRWRMAARKMMERENVIRFSAIQTLFNSSIRASGWSRLASSDSTRSARSAAERTRAFSRICLVIVDMAGFSPGSTTFFPRLQTNRSWRQSSKPMAQVSKWPRRKTGEEMATDEHG
jgi:hypothetical protein